MPKRCPIINRWTLRWGIVALLVIVVLLPSQLLAQSYALRVTLRDSAGQGVAGVIIVVRDQDGQELARQVTAADGAASFAELPTVVRVVVDGQLRGGPRLFQLGDDAQGVRLALDLAATPATLDLRAERDGLVLPDPATMLTLEQGGPIVETTEPFPTAALATPAPLPTPATGGADTAVVVVGAPGEAERPAAGWVPLVTVLIIVVAAAVMLLIQRRRASR